MPEEVERELDVPSVIEDGLLIGSIWHAGDAQVLRHLDVEFVVDAENPRKRLQRESGGESEVVPEIASGRIELDDDDTYESFKAAVLRANELIETARSEGKTVFVCCSHGNNESVVICVVYFLLSRQFTLERAFNLVRQRRLAAAPRRAYIEKLQRLEEETRGKVTLRSAQVGPSMMDLMRGLRGERTSVDGDVDTDDAASQTTDGEASSNLDRSSFLSNFSLSAMLHSGNPPEVSATEAIAERDEEGEDPIQPTLPRSKSWRRNSKRSKTSGCIIY